MSKLSIAKTAAGLITGIATSVVVQTAVKSYLPVDAKLLTRISFKVGGMALGGMANAAANTYIQREIQDVVDGFTVGKNLAEDENDNVKVIRADGTIIHDNN